MKRKLLFILACAALLCALCFSAGAIKADRPYKESKTIKIIDHVVYEYRKYPHQHYAVIDYFDTDEAANDRKIARTITIAKKVGKYPVTEIDVKTEYDDDYTPIIESGDCGSRKTTKINIPDSVTTLQPFAFSGFYFLRELTLPKGITEIPEHAFQGSTCFRSLTLKGELKKIGASAFEDCHDLRKFEFPDSLQEVGFAAFRHTGLKKISIPAKARYDMSVFSNCYDLNKVTFRGDAATKELWVSGGMFAESMNLKTVVFPQGLERLVFCTSAFGECGSLQTLKNYSALKRLDYKALGDCEFLEKLTIPAGIEYVHPLALLGCARLKTVHLNSKNTNLLKDSLTFYNQGLLEIGYLDCNFIDFLRNDCMIYVKNEAMLRMVQEDALHSRAQIAA